MLFKSGNHYVLWSGPMTLFWTMLVIVPILFALLAPMVQRAREAARREQAVRMDLRLQEMRKAVSYYHPDLGTIAFERFCELPADALEPENDLW